MREQMKASPIIAIVAIVAIVGLVAIAKGNVVQSGANEHLILTASSSEGNIGGQAYLVKGNILAPDRGPNDPTQGCINECESRYDECIDRGEDSGRCNTIRSRCISACAQIGHHTN